ncbi:MAG: DUF262 domain-containing protein [Nitrosopumilaceae archaeon]|nr:DUF262 domain-containing protein [Nitrosopumilaceae archaeon]
MTYSVATHAVREMLNHNKYEVPRYQRGYAWTNKQVEDFWQDLQNALKKDRHFFGTIYTDGDDKILDGQQRTTTVFLFLLAAKDYLKTKDAKELMNELEKYLLNGTKPKLTLSKFNDEYFQKLVNDSPNVKKPPNELENDSNLSMYKAYHMLRQKITRYGDKKGLDALKKLVDKLLQDFQIIQVTVKNSSDAYSMFNLVNNRGIPLNQYDLIRSHIFAKLEQLEDIDEIQIENVDKKWSQIAKNVRKTTNYSMDIFIQHILSFEFDVSVKDIFKELKDRVKSDKILGWVDAANEWSAIVKTLRSPSGNFCDHTGMSYDSERHIKRINKLGAVAVYPLLMAGLKKYWYEGDHTSFNRLAEVCLKYHLGAKTIGNASVSEYQRGLFKISRRCYKEDCSVNDIIDDLCETPPYMSGNDLEASLMVYRPRTSAALILLELIEAKRSDTVSHNTVTVEHIMPKDSYKWLRYICKIHDQCSEEYAKDIHQEYCSRLGNLTLLNKVPNSRLGNESFSIKSRTYSRSNYKITKEIAGEDQWGQDQIKRRQTKFIKDLVKILDIKALKTK